MQAVVVVGIFIESHSVEKAAMSSQSFHYRTEMLREPDVQTGLGSGGRGSSGEDFRRINGASYISPSTSPTAGGQTRPASLGGPPVNHGLPLAA